jgi:crotonobetainyl-CoA:carnitine CoA-transferase CaiB-like acyl-CoA transferase
MRNSVRPDIPARAPEITEGDRHTLFEEPVTVIEIGDSLAGAFCGRLLGQLGARVVKIEPPGGSPLRDLPPLLPGRETPVDDRTRARSAPYVAVNAGKEIITADLGSAAARGVIEPILAGGGMAVMSGPLAEWVTQGLDPRQLGAKFPSAIFGRVTLFGEDGPYADMAGGELQVQALGGLMNMVGEPPREPLRIGGFPAQYSTGLAMVTGFALALYRRSNAGLGSSFSTSVLETVANIEWKGALSYQDNGRIVTRGSDGAPAILHARDGFFAFFYRPGDWPRVLAIMDDPRLESDKFSTQEARTRNRPALLAILDECTSGMSKRELYHKTQAQGMTTGYMAAMGELLTSEQYQDRNFFTSVVVDGRTGVLPGPPWRMAGQPVGGAGSGVARG